MKKQTTLTEIIKKGYKIERIKSLDTYGTSSSGLLVRVGISATNQNGDCVNYQILFNSRCYGNTTQDIIYYNGRFSQKHLQYFKQVNEYLAKYKLDKIEY